MDSTTEYALELLLIKGSLCLPRCIHVPLPPCAQTLTIGRAKTCDIHLDSNMFFASGTHCALHVDPAFRAVDTPNARDDACNSSSASLLEGLVTPSKVKDTDEVPTMNCLPYPTVRVVDSGSSNGTFINGMRLATGTPYRLEQDDVIVFGGTRETAEGCFMDPEAEAADEIVEWHVSFIKATQRVVPPPLPVPFTPTRLVVPHEIVSTPESNSNNNYTTTAINTNDDDDGDEERVKHGSISEGDEKAFALALLQSARRSMRQQHNDHTTPRNSVDAMHRESTTGGSVGINCHDITNLMTPNAAVSVAATVKLGNRSMSSCMRTPGDSNGSIAGCLFPATELKVVSTADVDVLERSASPEGHYGTSDGMHANEENTPAHDAVDQTNLTSKTDDVDEEEVVARLRLSEAMDDDMNDTEEMQIVVQSSQNSQHNGEEAIADALPHGTNAIEDDKPENEEGAEDVVDDHVETVSEMLEALEEEGRRLEEQQQRTHARSIGTSTPQPPSSTPRRVESDTHDTTTTVEKTSPPQRRSKTIAARVSRCESPSLALQDESPQKPTSMEVVGQPLPFVCVRVGSHLFNVPQLEPVTSNSKHEQDTVQPPPTSSSLKKEKTTRKVHASRRRKRSREEEEEKVKDEAEMEMGDTTTVDAAASRTLQSHAILYGLTITATHLQWVMDNPNSNSSLQNGAKSSEPFNMMLPVTSIGNVYTSNARRCIIVFLRDGCRVPRVEESVLANQSFIAWRFNCSKQEFSARARCLEALFNTYEAKSTAKAIMNPTAGDESPEKHDQRRGRHHAMNPSQILHSLS